MSPPQGSFLKLWLAVPLWFSLTTQCSSFSKYLFHYITLVCLLVYFLHKRWELSNITHYQRNANQKKNNEVPLHAGQNDCHQKVYKQ